MKNKFIHNALTEKIPNTLKRWGKVFGDPVEVPASVAKGLSDPDRKQQILKNLADVGSVYDRNDLTQLMTDMLQTGIYRRQFYRECENSMSHAYVSSAIQLYVDNSVSYNVLQNASVWVTSDDPKLEIELNRMLQEIGIEERIKDWAGQIAAYGDFFIEAIGQDGLGVDFIDDDIHPADMERIDINGRLEGFIRTAEYGHNIYSRSVPVEAPWKYVHFRVFGVTRKIINTTLGIFGEPGHRHSLERRMMDKKRKFRITTKYGVSILNPVIPIYKRLKLAEDSLMMARMTRGILWYMYKIKVNGGNFDSALEIVSEYKNILKRRTGFDTSEGAEYWNDKFTGLFAQVEDIYVPTSDDLDIEVEKLGGEPNIRWIADIDMLENRLLGALRTSKSMLGITDDLPGSIGEGSANRISINFAKNAQSIQNCIRAGIKRLCQIHLAYRKMNVDPNRFDVHLAEISSAEEEELKNAMKSGTETVSELANMIKDIVGEDNLEKKELLDYLMKKFLKLDDFEINSIIRDVENAPASIKNKKFRESVNDVLQRRQKTGLMNYRVENTDWYTYLPNNQFPVALTEINNGHSRIITKQYNRTWKSLNVKFSKESEQSE